MWRTVALGLIVFLVVGCVSHKPASDAVNPPDPGYSTGHATALHPFSVHPDWVNASFSEDHPVFFWGVYYPAFMCEAAVFGIIG